MKKIGEGYFYIVYDLGNGRVIKKRKSDWHFFIHIMQSSGFSLSEYAKAIKNAYAMPLAYKKLFSILDNHSIIGNPTFLNDIEYEQDKVELLVHTLNKKTEKEQEKIIEDYIAQIIYLWTVGCHESIFNLTVNNGLNEKGEIVMLDFNEITFDKKAVYSDIDNKVWLKRWSFSQLSPVMKKFYAQRMEEEITIEKLEEVWETNKKAAS
ncbi:MAG: hypothetical protein ABIO57_00555 [Candidatus Paceibacterota bacterium]